MNVRDEITDLTACRALFAAWVFAYHVDLHAQFSQHLGAFAGLIRRGYLGVDGFFILSGLILTRVHPELKEKNAVYWRFWVRRLARLYPVHLAVIVLLGVFVVTGAVMGVAPRDPSRFGLPALAQNLLLIHGWGLGSPWAWNYPSWTISTEWAGYLVFPWLYRRFARWGRLVSGQFALIGIPALGLLAANTGHGLNVAGGWALLRFFAEFMLGMQAARMVPMMADPIPGVRMAIPGMLFALFALYVEIDLLVVLGLWLLLTGLTTQADAERPPLFRRLPWLRWLGLLSYAFYMSFATSELLLAQAFRHAGWDPARHGLFYAGAMTGLTFAIALVLHVLVENPCRRIADRLLTDGRKRPAAPARPDDGPFPGSSRASGGS